MITSMDEFVLRALLGGIGVAIVCGPLGCLVVWQRMAYFGAALSHAALFGIAIGFLSNINFVLSIAAVTIAVSCLLMAMTKNRTLSSDTSLGILAHSSLAFGIIVLSIIPGFRMDLMAYLFGEILSVKWIDVVWIYVGGGAVITGLILIWNPLLSLIIQRDLALVDGIKEQRIQLFFLVLISIVVAISMQIVGILLIVSLLVIPAASARPLAKSPEQMAGYAIIFGAISVCLGLACSMKFDTPAGPSMVAASTLMFVITQFCRTDNQMQSNR